MTDTTLEANVSALDRATKRAADATLAAHQAEWSASEDSRCALERAAEALQVRIAGRRARSA